MLRKLLFSLLFLSAMVGLAIWTTWPLLPHFRVAIPTSEGHLGTVPLLNAWIIWWNAESLSHGLRDYWDAPIFFPTKGAFAFSEPQPATLIFAPFVWCSRASITAYNLYLLSSIVLNGWFARRLLSQLHCTHLTAFCGGVAVTLHPLAWQNLEAIQLLPMWGILWTISNLIQLLSRPTWRTGAWTGVAFASTATTSIHHSLFLALILVFALPITIFALMQPKTRHRARSPAVATRLKRIVVAGSLAVVTACCLLLPMIGPMEVIHRQHAMNRSPELVASLSANLASWTSAPANSQFRHLLTYANEARKFPEPLLPGILSPLLVLVGITLCRHHRSSARNAVQLLFSVALVSFILSFGPGLGCDDWNAWHWAAKWLSPLGRIRSPYRFAYFTQLAMILIACLVVDSLHRRLKARSNWKRRVGAIASSAALFLLAFENIPSQIRLVFPPMVFGTNIEDDGLSWMSFVRSYEPATALICLPIASSDAESNQEQEARWMFCGTQHSVPILNGYSGFAPYQWQALSRDIRRYGLNDNVLERIKTAGANLIVAQTNRYQLPRNPRLSLLFDGENIQVWRLRERIHH